MSTELLFGSPQVWASAPSPALAYSQGAVPGSRLLNPLAPPNAVQTPTAFGPSMSGTISPIVNPLLLGEPAGGLTAAALLAAIAVRRGQPLGPTNDQEVEEFIGDALDVLSGSSDIEVRCEGGRVMLTGQVSHKRLKRDAGEIAWTIPNANDVQNNINVVSRRRSRSGREGEGPAAAARKQA